MVRRVRGGQKTHKTHATDGVNKDDAAHHMCADSADSVLPLFAVFCGTWYSFTHVLIHGPSPPPRQEKPSRGVTEVVRGWIQCVGARLGGQATRALFNFQVGLEFHVALGLLPQLPVWEGWNPRPRATYRDAYCTVRMCGDNLVAGGIGPTKPFLVFARACAHCHNIDTQARRT